MNEKKFIIVKCEELNDQYECDANREIDTNFYSQEQIEMMLESKGYTINCDYENIYNSKEEARQAFLDSLEKEDFEFFGEDLESEIEDSLYECDLTRFECYEITKNGLKFRQDLSNY